MMHDGWARWRHAERSAERRQLAGLSILWSAASRQPPNRPFSIAGHPRQARIMRNRLLDCYGSESRGEQERNRDGGGGSSKCPKVGINHEQLGRGQTYSALHVRTSPRALCKVAAELY